MEHIFYYYLHFLNMKNGTVGSLPSWGDLYAKEKTPKKTVQPFPLVSILYRYQSLICPANCQRMLGVKPFLPSGLDVVGLWPTSCAIRTVHTCLALQLRSRNFGASELRLSRPCRSRPLYRKKISGFFNCMVSIFLIYAGRGNYSNGNGQ